MKEKIEKAADFYCDVVMSGRPQEVNLDKRDLKEAFIDGIEHYRENLSDDDMIRFAEWFWSWRGHPDVGTHAYNGLKKWKEVNAEKIKNEH